MSPAVPPDAGDGTAPRVRSIGEALDGHRNALGLIRLLLAALVIVDHAFPLGGFGPSPLEGLTADGVSAGTFAVAGFFAISGYLITKSGASTDVLQYFWRRFLRIFPAFWVVLLVAALIVGPAVWVLDGRDLGAYFTTGPGGPLAYLRANWTLTINAWGIHDIFASTPYGLQTGSSVFNGSLWTLAYEWACYLLIGAFVATGVLLRARFVVPIATVFFGVIQLVVYIAPERLVAFPGSLTDVHFIYLTLTFLVGACIALYSDRVPFHGGLALVSAAVLLVSLRGGGFYLFGTAAGAYLVLYLAARLPRWFHRVGATNDYSYGVYIYGFLVTQVLAYLGLHRVGFLPLVAAALLLATGFAWLSWHLVEKRAMALKDRGPGRGWRHWRDRLGAVRRRGSTRRHDSEQT